MTESAVEGVTAFLIERAAGPARGLLRDRHGNGTGLGVLRDGGEQSFHRFLHRGGMPRRSDPGRARRRGGVGSVSVWGQVDHRFMPRRPEPSLRAADWGSGLVVGDGHEIAQGLFADVGPALDDLFGRRPLVILDLAGAEDASAAPASFYVFDALE